MDKSECFRFTPTNHLASRMKASALWFSSLATWILAGSAMGFSPSTQSEELWPILEGSGSYLPLEIQHPIEGAVLPQNFPAPMLLWKTNISGVTRWAVGFKAGARKWFFDNLQSPWRPSEEDWLSIKSAAGGQPIEMIQAGFQEGGGLRARSFVHFTISSDAVESPLFYREVNLPFSEAVKDPSKIRWRFGSLESGTGPPVVLSNLPVCGNCHSFSGDGQYLAMDVDYANSKASYIITRTAPEMRLATSDIITWNDYKKEDGQQTFGLLSQISPDGRYVLSTVKDRSVFVPRPDLAFSQLFFPLKGVIGAYDRQEKRFFALPGADDPEYVQSNPTWSPDGQWVVFVRNRAAELEKPRDASRVLLTPDECEEFLKRGKEFRYDLYRLPFNGGNGGKPEPLRGASRNRRSNYFPKYSPDGRWIVFCQASNYMLLQPDSEMFIIPSEGGEPRRLACNLSRMNSWHSWSPDGKWLVFTSKAHSDYTQLYLSRIDEKGEASPPVWLAHMVDAGRAANIPEFVRMPAKAITKIREEFLDDYSYTRAGNEFYRGGDSAHAIEKFRVALSMNPNNAMAHQRLGFLLYRAENQIPEAQEHLERAVKLEPNNAFARFDLGTVLGLRGDLTNAVMHLAEAVRLLPNGYDRQYNAVDMNYELAEARYRLKLYSECVPPLDAVLRRAPNHGRANYLMAMTKAWLGETDSTLPYFENAARSEPRMAQLPDYYDLLSRNYVKEGLFAKGFDASQKGYELAIAAGRSDQATRLQQRAEYCRKHKK